LALASCASRPGSIGAVLGQSRSDGRVTVRDAPRGLPAADAGIGPGDEVLLIDGRDVRGMSPEAIHQALEGDIGTTVHLTLLRGGKIERVALKRAPLAKASAR
jgi:carboxyl-terminal processing protease